MFQLFKKKAKEKKAVIFDLDGTLWDSSHEVVIAWNIALREFPELNGMQITDDDMHRFMGNTMDVIMDMMLGDDIGREFKNRVLSRCVYHEHEYLRENGAELYPDFLKVMYELKKQYYIAIVSNCQDGYIQVFLEHFALQDMFCDIEMFGRTGLQKGDNIKLLAERNGFTKVVYVGDTHGDELATRAANAMFVHASYGFGKAENPDGVIRSLSELPALCQKLLG